MTDKKRGRPKGSKGKKKEVVESTGLPDGVFLLDGSATKPPGYAIDMDKVPDRDLDKFVSSLPKIPTTPVTYPSNWNEMGKVQKLEWLTAHPRK